MWYPVLKTEDKAACEALAAKMNAELDYRKLVKFPSKGDDGVVARVDEYDTQGDGTVVWEVIVRPDFNGVVCGWLGLNGRSHLNEHGQGVKGNRTPSLVRCETKAARWLASQTKNTEAK